jgi:Flp pilus assembly protein TadG
MVLYVIAMVVLLGFAALAVDGGLVYTERRRIQNAADTGALAAALAKIEAENLHAAAHNTRTVRSCWL